MKHAIGISHVNLCPGVGLLATPGIVASFSTQQMVPGSSVTLTLSAPSATVGDYRVTVAGSGGEKTHAFDILIRVVSSGSQSSSSTFTTENVPTGPEVGIGLTLILALLAIVTVIGWTIISGRARQAPPRELIQQIRYQPIEPTQQMAWFCRYCGRNIDYGSTFCCYCGQTLD
jgi:hypothetical protein